MLWNIFCNVIDNHGDVGVCWRLSAMLAGHGQQVRLWLDDPRDLEWMAPLPRAAVERRHWNPTIRYLADDVGDVLVEAFGCNIPEDFVTLHVAAAAADGQRRIWINLEYLSAEPAAWRSHGLPSPVRQAQGEGVSKFFYYPGFVAASGGLLREDDLLERRGLFDREAWLHNLGIAIGDTQLISLFCYEPRCLDQLLLQIARAPRHSRLLVTAGRAQAATRAAVAQLNVQEPSWNKRGALSFSMIPQLTQTDYDHLLWACDINFVRGEDSWVRAVWAGRPMVWQCYPQQDQAHHAKLQAWLDMLQPPVSLRQFHRIWNAASDEPLPELEPVSWSACLIQLRQQLLQQPDLCTRLLRFVAEKR